MKSYTQFANLIMIAGMVTVVFLPGLILGCKTIWGIYKEPKHEDFE